MQGIAVHLVVTAGEAPRRAFRQGLNGIIRLALIDQYSREPEACDLLELRVLGVVHDLGQGRNGIGGPAALVILVRPPPPRLICTRAACAGFVLSLSHPPALFWIAYF